MASKDTVPVSVPGSPLIFRHRILWVHLLAWMAQVELEGRVDSNVHDVTHILLADDE